MTNILRAIHKAAQNGSQELLKLYKSKNRANAMGDALEEYVKDLFAGTSIDQEIGSIIQEHSNIFSYDGNQNNPPDFILRGSDAVEVKKLRAGKVRLN